MDGIKEAVSAKFADFQTRETWGDKGSFLIDLFKNAVINFWSMVSTEGSKLAPYTVDYLPTGVRTPVVNCISAVAKKATEHPYVASAVTTFAAYKIISHMRSRASD